MSISHAGFIGPALNGVASPATFTTNVLITANTNAAAKMIVIRGWAVGASTGGDSITVALSSAQPTFTSACFNPVGGTACYGTVPIYGIPNSNVSDGTPGNSPPGPGFFFAAVVVPLVNLPAGATFSLTPTFGTVSKIYAIGELYTGTVQPPGTFASTTWDGSGNSSGGTVDSGYSALTMTTAVAVAADASMALTFQYTDTSTTCCVKCGTINALFSAGDAAADGAWDAGSTDVTWTDTFGTVYASCRDCIGYSPVRDRDYQVMLGHNTVTPSSTYTLTGTASMPNVINQCLVGTATIDTRPRTGQRQTVFILRDHAPLACCPAAPPPFVSLEGQLSFQAGGDPIMGPGSIPPQQSSGSAQGKISFKKA